MSVPYSTRIGYVSNLRNLLIAQNLVGVRTAVYDPNDTPQNMIAKIVININAAPPGVGVVSVNGQTGVVEIDASDVGLGSVNNTSDANKPVSTAQQTALNLKANSASPTLTGAPLAPTAAPGTDTTQIATTAFVTAAVAGGGGGGYTAVANFAALPAATAHNNETYLVLAAQGVIWVNRKPAGLYTSNGSAWNLDADQTDIYLAGLTPTNGQIPVGNGTNFVSKSVSGDAALAASGALTLATVNSNVGSFTNANLMVDGKGRITAAENGTPAPLIIDYITPLETPFSVLLPAGYTTLEVWAISGGGGGASGRVGAVGSYRGGGAGASGASFIHSTFAVADITGPLTVTIGSGGLGGDAVTDPDTDGNQGGNGGPTRVQSANGHYLAGCDPGQVGEPGSTITAAGGATQDLTFTPNPGGAGGDGTNNVGAEGKPSTNGSSGGGAGGGINVSNQIRSGGAGGIAQDNIDFSSGPGAGGNTSSGGGNPGSSAGDQLKPYPGSGGGGGSSSITKNGGSGGTGKRGGGGGGGGAALNGFSSGPGGSGGDGFIRFIWR